MRKGQVEAANVQPSMRLDCAGSQVDLKSSDVNQGPRCLVNESTSLGSLAGSPNRPRISSITKHGCFVSSLSLRFGGLLPPSVIPRTLSCRQQKMKRHIAPWCVIPPLDNWSASS